jgi:hypothetical protein
VVSLHGYGSLPILAQNEYGPIELKSSFATLQIPQLFDILMGGLLTGDLQFRRTI